MRVKILLLCCSFCSLILFVGCPMNKWFAFDVYNKSDKTIYVCASFTLPDTLLPIQPPRLIIITPDRIGNVHGYHINDEKFERLQSERVTVFIIDKDSVDKYSWQYLREHNVILKKYELNKKELVDIEWTIKYPY